MFGTAIHIRYMHVYVYLDLLYRRQLYHCYVVVNKRRPVHKRIGVPQNFGILYAFGMYTVF